SQPTEPRAMSRKPEATPESYVTGPAAAELLGVKMATLYAYASRGLVRSEPSGAGRARRYRTDDLLRLRTRRDARSGHGPVAAGALHWGEPVLETAVGTITDEGPVYRGQRAVELATGGVSFERVAELLWSGSLPNEADWNAAPSALRVRSLGAL